MIYGTNINFWTKGSFTLNDSCVQCFSKIIKKDKFPHIILSSTWRAGYSNIGEKSSGNNLSKLEEYGIVIEDITPISNKTRQEEIEYYIRKNAVKDYIILDDDESLFPWPDRINLYLTDYKTVLTEEIIMAFWDSQLENYLQERQRNAICLLKR